MKKASLVLILIFLSTTTSYAKASGYTFFYLTRCGSDVEKQYQTHCAAVVSQVFYVNDCEPTQSDGCHEWDWGDDVETNVSGIFSRISAKNGVYPKKEKNEAKKERNEKIRSWKHSNYKIIYYNK